MKRLYSHSTRVHSDRLRRLHATALGLYMASRILGRDGEVQRQRMERIGAEIDKYT